MSIPASRIVFKAEAMPSIARQRGKAMEKATAKRLGGHRVGVTGLATCDVDGVGPWDVECKSRTKLPALIRDAMAQAVRNARPGKVPLVLLHQVGDRHDADIVCLRLKDFEDWNGVLYEPS